MHWIVERLRATAQKNPKKILFPEPKDDRVREAVAFIEKEGIARPLIVDASIMDKARQEEFAAGYFERHQKRCAGLDEARKLMEDPLYYTAMMTRSGLADGFVAGAIYSTSSVARAAIRCLEVDTRIGVASGCFTMAVPGSNYGEKGVLIFSDCAVVPQPSAEQLAAIGVAAAEFTRDILMIPPQVAFLSFSTHGSAKNRLVEKVREAVELFKKAVPDIPVDGELQADSALDAGVAKRKLPASPVAGKANVLVFPDLEAGNISYKLAQRLAKARALGPILLGLKQCCSDLSRGCSVDDIVDCAALTAIRAHHLGSKAT